MRRRDFIALLGGATIPWPDFAMAELEHRPYRIGYLALAPSEDAQYMRTFVQRLRELGLVEGQNLTILYRSAEDRSERLPQLASELVGEKPDVLVAGFGTLAAKAAKMATATVPIVFTSVGDPIGAGLVESLGRPTGNITGLSSQTADLGGKQLQMVQELVPSAKRIAVLGNPETPFTRLALQNFLSASRAAGITLEVLEATRAEDMPSRFEAVARVGAAGLVVLADPLTISLRQQLINLARANRVPTLYADRLFAEAGGLMSYAPDRTHMFSRAAEYVYQILDGSKPSDLVIEQPTKFELVINLKTAKHLGLTSHPLSLPAPTR